jgi:S-adenosylmethionine:tRNA ribosyltransferase-isomerase
MKTEILNYDLPDGLIAQHPSQKRQQSRLLVLNRKTNILMDQQFNDLGEYLRAGDCLVLNNTKVLPARFYAKKQTGAQLEGLFVQEDSAGGWQVLLKNARKIKSGESIVLLDRNELPWSLAVATHSTVKGQWLLHPQVQTDILSALNQIGLAPLPPYIKRERNDAETADDLERYQTVYASQPGAVAAPTAGLHFNKAMLEQLQNAGIKLAYVTLHVGIGTFRPVQTETLEAHPMHEERYEITSTAADTINAASDANKRIIAVGTTSVRTLESVAENRQVRPEQGKTKLFIRPGYHYKIVDAMVTNFHLPKSTLMALVGAFAGLDNVHDAYRHAIHHKYRFYSYGDAMFIY